MTYVSSTEEINADRSMGETKQPALLSLISGDYAHAVSVLVIVKNNNKQGFGRELNSFWLFIWIFPFPSLGRGIEILRGKKCVCLELQ